MKKLLVILMLMALPIHGGLSEETADARETKEQRTATVAGGKEVPLADSAHTDDEWQAKRPEVEDL